VEQLVYMWIFMAFCCVLYFCRKSSFAVGIWQLPYYKTCGCKCGFRRWYFIILLNYWITSVSIQIRITAIIRPHRSTAFVDAAYCYRPSSMVCQSVCLSVGGSLW